MFGGNFFFTFGCRKGFRTCRFRTVGKLLLAGYADDVSAINNLEKEEVREEVIVPLFLSKLSVFRQAQSRREEAIPHVVKYGFFPAHTFRKKCRFGTTLE